MQARLLFASFNPRGIFTVGGGQTDKVLAAGYLALGSRKNKLDAGFQGSFLYPWAMSEAVQAKKRRARESGVFTAHSSLDVAIACRPIRRCESRENA